jgi:hypothetical protein
MSTVQQINFEPFSDILATQRRDFALSDKTLAKALSKNVEYNGFYFKEIGEKLKC